MVAQHSCLFQPTSDEPLDEEEVRSAEAAGKDTARGTKDVGPVKTYEFRPRFEDLAQTIDSEEGRLSDTWAVAQKHVSVTPLRANFQHVPFSAKDREIKL